MANWATLVCSLGAFLCFCIWIWKRKEVKYHLPCYRGWPVFGNLFQIMKGKPELLFTEWAKDLGPIFTVNILHKKLVILSSFDAIYEALVVKGNRFAHRPNKNAYRMELMTDQFRNIFRMDPNPTWKKLRKVCQKKIKMYDTGMNRIEDISMAMIKDLMDEFRSQKRSFNPKDILYNAVMNMIMTLMLGRTFSTDEELFQKFMKFEQSIIKNSSPSGKGSELDVCPWLRFFGHKAHTRVLNLIQLRNQIWELVKEEASIGDQRLAAGEEDVRIVTALRETLAEEDSELSERHLRVVVVFDMVFAGTATTANSLYMYLSILSQHPNVQAKLQEEVDAIVGTERYVSLADKKDMHYTQATMLELLRYSSVVPLSIPHMAQEDTAIQGKVIQAGDTVHMNLYALHHDEEFWSNPYAFQPERFLDDEGHLLSASHVNRRHLMPFGAGPRGCLGEILAKSRIFLIIASLAQKFNINPGEVTAPCDPRLLVDGVLRSSADYEIVAEERE